MTGTWCNLLCRFHISYSETLRRAFLQAYSGLNFDAHSLTNAHSCANLQSHCHAHSDHDADIHIHNEPADGCTLSQPDSSTYECPYICTLSKPNC